MSRIRLNQEYRNKVNSRMRVHLEAEDTQERNSYVDLKADQLEINDNAWKLAEQIVRKHYTPEDIVKAKYLQDKFENVDLINPGAGYADENNAIANAIAKDSQVHLFLNAGDVISNGYINDIESDRPNTYYGIYSSDFMDVHSIDQWTTDDDGNEQIV